MHGNTTVGVEYHYSHRRNGNEQVEKVILLAYAQPLGFQPVHHGVEHVHDSVGLGLPDLGESAAEILCAYQIHTVGYPAHWQDYFAVIPYCNNRDDSKKSCADGENELMDGHRRGQLSLYFSMRL